MHLQIAAKAFHEVSLTEKYLFPIYRPTPEKAIEIPVLAGAPDTTRRSQPYLYSMSRTRPRRSLRQR